MFKTTRQLKSRSKIWIGLILWVFSATNLWGGWSTTVIDSMSSASFLGMAIGNGRNDDTSRIYILYESTIRELTCRSGIWSVEPVEETRGFGQGICLASGRNDGMKRIYVADKDTVFELTHNSGHWERAVVGKCPQWILDIQAGTGRNDSIVRIYALGGGIYEFSYSDGNWTRDSIAGPYGKFYLVEKEQNKTSHIGGYPIAIGKGRNDDTVRLYCGRFGEFTYSEGGWVKDDLPLWGGSQLLVCKGRNDNIYRLYDLEYWIYPYPQGVSFYEMTYSEGNWALDTMDFLADPDTTGPGDAGPQHIAAGKVRGDDTIRLYIPGPYNTLHEYTYSNGLWRDTIIEQGLCGIHLVIGNGRNDGKERLYSAAHNKVFEHNYSLGIEESNPLPFDKGELLQVFPNPSVKGFYIQYAVPSKSSIVLEVFDSSGRKVRTLLNDCKDEGIYKIYWNAKTNSKESLGAGVYFCRMRVKEQTLIKKILLLR